MERFCADPVARSVNHPPTQPGPWSAGQLVSRCHWSGGGAAGQVSERVKNCCKCPNCCHNKQLWQQLGPFWWQMQQQPMPPLCNLTKDGGSRGRCRFSGPRCRWWWPSSDGRRLARWRFPVWHGRRWPWWPIRCNQPEQTAAGDSSTPSPFSLVHCFDGCGSAPRFSSLG